MSGTEWTVSFGPGGHEGIPFPPDPNSAPYEAGKCAEFDRWLLRIKRQAWEEGFSSGAYRGQDLDDDYGAENPYWR